MKRAVVFIFVLFLAASMLTSCVNVSSGTPDPSEKAEYLSWNRAEWENADDAEKVKCTAVLLSYITELSGENNVLVEKILALGAPELVDDVGQARLGLVHAHEAARGVRIVGCSDGAEVQHVVGACAQQEEERSHQKGDSFLHHGNGVFNLWP